MLILRNRPESIGYIDFLIENATEEELSAPELDRTPSAIESPAAAQLTSQKKKSPTVWTSSSKIPQSDLENLNA
jgi:hypothetical protein